jgi:hypothetical protein
LANVEISWCVEIGWLAIVMAFLTHAIERKKRDTFLFLAIERRSPIVVVWKT